METITSDTLQLPAPCTAEPLDPALHTELLTQIEERGQITVHCILDAGFGDAIRIWPTTYLVCRYSGHRSRLLHAEGIPFAPQWQPVSAGRKVSFTLLFEGLPKECVLFDLLEDIPDEGGFFSPAILRNGMDVYRVEV